MLCWLHNPILLGMCQQKAIQVGVQYMRVAHIQLKDALQGEQKPGQHKD